MDVRDFQKYNEHLMELNPGENKLIMCFSTPYLLSVNHAKFVLGSQDISALIDEVVTGELTGHQLASCGVKYVLVGHSERRIWKKEINIDFINKITEAQNNGINVIYCIGESLKEKVDNKTEEVLEKQIKEVLNNVTLKNIIIAYEPVWAIGTGKTALKDDIANNVKFIKQIIKENYDLNFPVLYGGSINHDNIEDLIEIKELDGFLVGSASLDWQNVVKILDTMHKD